MFEISIFPQNTNLSYIVKHLGWNVLISHRNNFGIYLKKKNSIRIGRGGSTKKSYFHFASGIAPYYHIIPDEYFFNAQHGTLRDMKNTNISISFGLTD